MSPVPRHVLPAPTIYLILRGGFSLFFSMVTTVNIIYQVEVAGLNPLQLVLIGTMLETVVFLGEVPTGVVADVFSRRLSIIIGHAVVGIGFLVEGSFPFFAAILLAQVVWGLGYTFISGARDAWIADEVGEERAAQLYLRGAQAGQIGTLAAIPISVALASLQLNLPILLGGALFVALALALALTMPEHGFRPAPRAGRSDWQVMGATLGDGVKLIRQRPVLLTILGIAAIGGMASEGFDRLWTPHLLDDFRFPSAGGVSPVVWFGILKAIAILLSLGITEVLRRRLDLSSHLGIVRALLGTTVLLATSMVVFGLTGDFVVAIMAYWGVSALRRVNEPLSLAWVNQHLDPRVRATVLSMSGQADAFGQIAGGPLLGVLAVGVSLPAALAVSGLTLLSAVPFYLLAMRQSEAAKLRTQ